MSTPLKLVFLGSDVIALPLLNWLAGDARAAARVVGVFTQPDRPKGRGQHLVPGPVKQWAATHGVPVRQPAKLTAEDHAWLAAQQADLALVVAYGQILRDAFIAVPRLGTLNLHASLLPRYRGASPIQTAVAAGDRETGMALMRIVRRLDAGPVADVERVAIGPLDTAADVEARLAAAAIPLLTRALPRLAEGRLEFREQDEAAASYCRRLTKADGALDFGATAAALAARINGLFPWPGCAVEIAGQTVRLGLAEALTTHGDAREERPAPGTVLGSDADGLLVAAGEGVLRLRRLQRPGGRMLAAADFLRGFPVPAGMRLASRPMAALVTPQPARG